MYRWPTNPTTKVGLRETPSIALATINSAQPLFRVRNPITRDLELERRVFILEYKTQIGWIQRYFEIRLSGTRLPQVKGSSL